MTSQNETSKGMILAISCYTFWGLAPIYWKFLSGVPNFETTIHRVFWASICYLIWAFWKGQGPELIKQLKRKRVVGGLLLTGALLFSNWALFNWAVVSGQIVASSLGYFINPLLNILLGVVFLKETLNKPQKIAISLVVVAVALLTYVKGELPWLSLVLAATFGLYGLVRKTLSLPAIVAMPIESLFMMLPGLVVIGHFVQTNPSYFQFPHYGLSTWVLLAITGPFTAFPLIWFNEAARRLPYSTLGFVQYIGPSLQFLVGLFLYKEPFSLSALACFALIWFAIALVLRESLRNKRKAPKPQPDPVPAPKSAS